jgi:putative ABC transport system permease protein
MNLLTIAWKSLRLRALSSALTAFSVSLGVMLMIAVLVINGIVGDTFSQRNVGASLVVGPPGSDLAMVLSAIYRVGNPGEPLPYRFYRDVLLGKDQEWSNWIEYAIPMTMGDVTEQGSFPIVGTTPQYFGVEYGPGRKYSLKGELLYQPFEAVIGSRVARENNWDVGSELKLVHGGAESDHVHDEKFKVVGVLAPTGTPNDRTVFINIEGFYMISGHEKPPQEAIDRLRAFGFEVTPAQEKAILAAGDHSNHDHGDHAGHDHGIPDDLKEVSFILVRTKTVPQSIMLSSKLNDGVIAQAVNPIFPMNALMKNVVGNVRVLLLFLTGLIVIVAGVGIFVSIYNSMADRKREIAIMRALGAQRTTVFSIILGEAILLCVGGGLLGLLLGHGLVFVAAPIVELKTGLPINPLKFETMEFVIFPVLIVMSGLIGILPGLTAYRTDVAQSLTD